MGVVPTDVDESGSERVSFELPSPQHGGVGTPALLSPTVRGVAGHDVAPAQHSQQQQRQQPQPPGYQNGAFLLPDPGGAAAAAAAERPLNGDLYGVAPRGKGGAAVGVGYSPRGPARQPSSGQQQPHTGDLASSPRNGDAGAEASGGRPPSGQLPQQQQQQQHRQQRPRDLPMAIPRLPLGVSLGDGCAC